ncbi:Rho GDP-dissociation inhibitor 1 [Linum perenne]
MSSSSKMGLDENKNEGSSEEIAKESGDERGAEKITKNMSQASLDDDDDDDEAAHQIELGPQQTLKEQLEKDKDDESLRKWKEQLLGSVDYEAIGGSWFTLKEGSPYKLKFDFQVSNNIVSGLKYTNAVWKTGVKVDGTKEMLGTFSPQPEAYIHEMPEEVTPSGMFARGSYTARSKFVDDDNKCYLEINYTFDIRKEWAATT